MKFNNKACLLLLCSCLITAPAFAQKGKLPKAIQKATQKTITKNASGAVGAAGAHQWKTQTKNVRIEPSLQKLLATRAKNAATDYYKDVMLFRLYDKEYGIVPAVNDFMYELVQDIGIVQNGPALSFKTNSSRRVLQAELSPKTVRQRLLKAEHRLQKTEKSWKAWKSLNFKIMPFVQSYNAYDCSWWIQPYLSGQQDIIQVISFRYQDIRALYNKMLAWAHGEEKFPFSFETVSQILELNVFSDAKYDALYNALNSSGCDILRDWGWSDADIRQFIKMHQEAGQIDGTEFFSLRDRRGIVEFANNYLHLHKYTPSELEHLYKTLDSIELRDWASRGWPKDTLRAIIKFYQQFSSLGCLSDYHLSEALEHSKYYSTVWLNFWNFNIEQNQENVLRIRQQLQENP